MINTWRCDVCGKERPDAAISVLSKPIPYGQYNIKYCNDNPECINGAKDKEIFKNENN